MYKYCNTFDGRILSKSKNKKQRNKKNRKKNNKQTKRKKKNPEYGQIFRKKKKKKNNNMVASDVEIIQKMENKSWFSIEKTILKCINPNKAGHFKGSYCLDRVNLIPSPPSHNSRKNNLILAFRSL